jgi:hypothetical protein
MGTQGKFGPGIAVQRQDWLKTHSSSGPSLLYHASPSGTAPASYHSTLNQLVQGTLLPYERVAEEVRSVSTKLKRKGSFSGFKRQPRYYAELDVWGNMGKDLIKIHF